MPIEEGGKAPAFTLKDAAGKSVKLADYAGQDVVVYFYPRDDTPGCTKEACGFRDLWADFRKRKIAVLGISPDGAAAHATLYGKKVVGVIRSTVWIGPDGKVVKHWKRVAKAADHPAQVLAAIAGR